MQCNIWLHMTSLITNDDVRIFWELHKIERDSVQSESLLRKYLPSAWIHYYAG